ncbi:hypothetical protein [Joostella sp. CR20]|uniref:hypothetical protein n=1 Tax=Joostella sp. CR20 TaxID=2804312 RepID=UPI00313D32B1
MKTIEEVKEHFKDAKVVRCLEDWDVYDVSELIEGVHVYFNNFWVKAKGGDILLYDAKNNRLAEIIEYKNPQSKFKETLNSLADLLEYKNKKYGNSALEPLEIFSNKTKVGTRLDDKLARIKNSDKLHKNDVADIIGYLTLVCVEKDWTNFNEFKD